MLKESIKTISRAIFTILVVLSLTGCFLDGGGGDSDSSGTAPTLVSFDFFPTEAAAGVQLSISGNFSFEDPDGDLGGGFLKYEYEGDTFGFPLDESLDGHTNADVLFSATVNISQDVGDKELSFWLVDNNGNLSNIIKKPFKVLWSKLIGSVEDDDGDSIIVDTNNNVIATGSVLGDMNGHVNAGYHDVFITKYSPSGILEWDALIGTNAQDYGKNLVADSDGNIYVVGYTEGYLDLKVNQGLFDAFLIKYSPLGLKIWTQLIGTINNDYGIAVAVDNQNYIYLVGNTEGDLDSQTNTGATDVFLSKFSSSGAKLWTRLFGTTSNDYVDSIATDRNGNIFITGQTGGTFNANFAGSAVFVTKFDQSGNVLWIEELESFYMLSTLDLGKGDICIDINDDIVVTGRAWGVAADNKGRGDLFITKYDQDGSNLWFTQVGETTDDEGRGIVIDSQNNIYVVGDVGPFHLLMKYDSEGNQIWSMGGTFLTRNDIAIDSSDNLFVIGDTTIPVDFNPIIGGEDIFIEKYDVNGVKH